MSLTEIVLSAPGTLTTEMQNWIATCPDPAGFKRTIEILAGMQQKMPCYQCGEEYRRFDLRFDEATIGGDNHTLICTHCWHIYEDRGTLGDPSYRAPPWPKHVQLTEPDSNLSDGLIYDIKLQGIIGQVAGYHARDHTAHRVTLYGNEINAEGGFLDPAWVVLPNDVQHVILANE